MFFLYAKNQNTDERNQSSEETDTYHVHGLEDSMSILFKLIYGFNTFLIKIPARLFVEIDKITPKCTWRGKKKLEWLK